MWLGKLGEGCDIFAVKFLIFCFFFFQLWTCMDLLEGMWELSPTVMRNEKKQMT